MNIQNQPKKQSNNKWYNGDGGGVPTKPKNNGKIIVSMANGDSGALQEGMHRPFMHQVA